jgi:class 3 adenylate cyclase
LASILLGWAGSPARWFAEYLRQSVDERHAKAAIPAIGQFDVSQMLPHVTAPTLVIHRRMLSWPSIDRARRLAAEIPGARLCVLEGNSGAPFMGNTREVLEEVDEFLEASHQSLPRVLQVSGTAVILFTDVVSSAALTERMGDVAFREKARRLDIDLRQVIRDKGGAAIEGKLLGDGVLAIFTSAHEAIEAALQCSAAGDLAGLSLHLGIHAGDVIHEDRNVYGGAVNVASRVSGLSGPGEVLVSETVRSLARTSAPAGMVFADKGEHQLKGIEEHVRIWAVNVEV